MPRELRRTPAAAVRNYVDSFGRRIDLFEQAEAISPMIPEVTVTEEKTGKRRVRRGDIIVRTVRVEENPGRAGLWAYEASTMETKTFRGRRRDAVGIELLVDGNTHAQVSMRRDIGKGENTPTEDWQVAYKRGGAGDYFNTADYPENTTESAHHIDKMRDTGDFLIDAIKSGASYVRLRYHHND